MIIFASNIRIYGRTSVERSQEALQRTDAYLRAHPESNHGEDVWVRTFGECPHRKEKKQV